MAHHAGRFLAEDRGAFDIAAVEADPSKPDPVTRAAVASIWETAHMGPDTVAWILNKWRAYGDLD